MVAIGVRTVVAWLKWSGSKWRAPNKVCSNINIRVVERMSDLIVQVWVDQIVIFQWTAVDLVTSQAYVAPSTSLKHLILPLMSGSLLLTRHTLRATSRWPFIYYIRIVRHLIPSRTAYGCFISIIPQYTGSSGCRRPAVFPWCSKIGAAVNPKFVTCSVQE
jgi:hypothetical protein